MGTEGISGFDSHKIGHESVLKDSESEIPANKNIKMIDKLP